MIDKRLNSWGLKLCKIYFWFALLIYSLGLLLGAITEKGTVNDYINLIIMVLMFIGAFGFLYRKRILKPLFWKIILGSLLIWDIYYTFIFPIFLSSKEFVITDLLISYLMQIPFYICLYLYSFKFSNIKFQSADPSPEPVRVIDDESNDIDTRGMESYKLFQGVYTKTKWVEVLRINLFPSLFFVICVAIVIYNFSVSNNIIAICFTFGLIYISIQWLIETVQMSKRMKKSWLKFRILINDEKIAKQQQNAPYTEIQREQISCITETEDLGLMIQTNDNVKQIFIPLILDGYNELKEKLSQWCGIKKASQVNNAIKKKLVREMSISRYVFNEAVNKKRKPKSFVLGCLFNIIAFIVLFILILYIYLPKYL